VNWVSQYTTLSDVRPQALEVMLDFITNQINPDLRAIGAYADELVGQGT
jgi:hypothetical protein